MKKLTILMALVLGMGFTSAMAQELSPERKLAIDSLALEKVRDLSK